jgi:hypothetical protein
VPQAHSPLDPKGLLYKHFISDVQRDSIRVFSDQFGGCDEAANVFSQLRKPGRRMVVLRGLTVAAVVACAKFSEV